MKERGTSTQSTIAGKPPHCSSHSLVYSCTPPRLQLPSLMHSCRAILALPECKRLGHWPGSKCRTLHPSKCPHSHYNLHPSKCPHKCRPLHPSKCSHSHYDDAQSNCRCRSAGTAAFTLMISLPCMPGKVNGRFILRQQFN